MSDMKFLLRLASIIMGLQAFNASARAILAILEEDWVWLVFDCLAAIASVILTRALWKASRYGVILDKMIEAHAILTPPPAKETGHD